MTVIRLFVTLTIVALAAVTVAAPATKTTKTAAVATPAKPVKALSPPSHRLVRRNKRSVIVQVPVEIPDDVAEDQELEAELSQLSDEQLEMLAEVVQSELDRFDPQVPLQQDRRSLPVEPMDDEEEEQLVFVPQEVLEEALMEEALEEAAEEELAQELDDIELRARIGEMANILNERASRGSRRRR
ncbi:hypothetical protein PRIPAC_84661 [Pristionchus pacificus]|uniref:Uncharacterized protein n=1 Tax=Pristionchus pacificus TaxID=54126 RepID=A0A2A6BN55_PRIPA|nr:hypothetical protein PRIPAC_84661 [Pristionchus pacificus]|eukprot:PDM67347.1 hypothetical protein PRIPAC_48764 [Pristionchus pacificus]